MDIDKLMNAKCVACGGPHFTKRKEAEFWASLTYTRTKLILCDGCWEEVADAITELENTYTSEGVKSVIKGMEEV